MRVARAAATAPEPETAFPLECAVDAVGFIPVVVVGAELGPEQRQEAVIGPVGEGVVECESVASRCACHLEVFVHLDVGGGVGDFDGDAQFVRPVG